MRTGRRPQPPSLETLVDREVDAMDRIAARVRGRALTPAEFNELETQAQRHAIRIVAAFRGQRN